MRRCAGPQVLEHERRELEPRLGADEDAAQRRRRDPREGEEDDERRRVAHRLEEAALLGRELRTHPGDATAGHRHDDGVGVERAGAAVLLERQPRAVREGLDAAHGAVAADAHARGQRGGERARAALEARELGAGPVRAQRGQHAQGFGVRASGCGQPRERRRLGLVRDLRGELSALERMHVRRIDAPLERRAPRARRTERVRCRHHRGHGVAAERPQHRVAHPGVAPVGVGADRVGESERIGHDVDRPVALREGRRAEVELEVAAADALHAPARLRRALEHLHLVSRAHQPPRAGEACDAASDDRDAGQVLPPAGILPLKTA